MIAYGTKITKENFEEMKGKDNNTYAIIPQVIAVSKERKSQGKYEDTIHFYKMNQAKDFITLSDYDTYGGFNANLYFIKDTILNRVSGMLADDFILVEGNKLINKNIINEVQLIFELHKGE